MKRVGLSSWEKQEKVKEVVSLRKKIMENVHCVSITLECANLTKTLSFLF